MSYKFAMWIRRSNRSFLVGAVLLSTLASQSVGAVTDEIAIQRLVELSRIPTSASVNEVIALATEGSTNEMRLQFAVTALIHIGPSLAGDAYIKSILGDVDSPPVSVKGALAYFAERPEIWMAPYATQFLADTYSGEIRSQAAYLAGALGMTAKIETIETVVNNNTYGDARLEAAYGLANLLPEAEFAATIDATGLSDWDKKLAKQLNTFLQADNSTKDGKVSSYLNKSEFILSLVAMRHMLETENEELLKHYVVRESEIGIDVPSPMHNLMLRILGYEISGDIDNLTISTVQAF